MCYMFVYCNDYSTILATQAASKLLRNKNSQQFFTA